MGYGTLPWVYWSGGPIESGRSQTCLETDIGPNIGFVPIVLKNSKSGGAEFFARRKGNREFTLDLPPHAVSRLHVAKARVRPPPRPKIVHGPLRRRNSSIFGGKGVFQQNLCQSRSKKGPFAGGIVGHSFGSCTAPWRECSPYS